MLLLIKVKNYQKSLNDLNKVLLLDSSLVESQVEMVTSFLILRTVGIIQHGKGRKEN